MRREEYAWEMEFGIREFRRRARYAVIELVKDFVYAYELNDEQCVELYDEILGVLDEFYEKMLVENLS